MAALVRNSLRRLSAEFPATRLEWRVRRALLRIFRRPFDSDFAILKELGLPADGLVIDVGAHHGFAIDAIRLMMPSARIVAFEPNPAAADDVERAFGRSIVLHRCALGASRGMETLYVPQYGRRVLDGLGSFERNKAVTWLRGRTVGRDDVVVATIEVPVRLLDEFGLAPCLIKIDVQGAETRVIRGALETIRQHRPVLFVENPEAVALELLAPLGYRAYPLRNGAINAKAARATNVLLTATPCV